MAVIGWDVGGAHLKAARVEDGRVVKAAQIACPLWQGPDRLDAALEQAIAEVGGADRHAATMTGELSDVFAGRSEGVAWIAGRLSEALGAVTIYGGRRGWLAPDEAAAHIEDVASANWHASATLIALRLGDALFVDMGSTTTDIVPVANGGLKARGYTDAERLATGELVFTGATRTALMAVARRAPFRGAWTGMMKEYFATMADVHRILGDLPDGADLHATADGRERSVAASRARLARMVGADAADATDGEWTALSRYFAEAQLREIHDAASLVLSAVALAPDAPVVGAGTGTFVARRLADRLGRCLIDFGSLIPVASGAEAAASTCAPAAALALLAAQGGSG